MNNFLRRARRESGVHKLRRVNQEEKSTHAIENCNQLDWSSTIRRCVTHFTLPSPVKRSARSLGIRPETSTGKELFFTTPVAIKEKQCHAWRNFSAAGDLVEQSLEYEVSYKQSSCVEQEEVEKVGNGRGVPNNDVEYDDNLLRDVARIIQLRQAIALIKAYLFLSDCPCSPCDCIGAALHDSLKENCCYK
ncbi:hypothetical protein V3C99_005214, partial [Haemonchus contortus]|uniref:Uncharacterized protein n=1 Tax=Haemonchus contortus TaxID=6289 RepID=A0A7I4XWF4_HAECO